MYDELSIAPTVKVGGDMSPSPVPFCRNWPVLLSRKGALECLSAGVRSEWRLGREDEDECRESVLVLKNAVDNYGCCTLECLHAVFFGLTV